VIARVDFVAECFWAGVTEQDVRDADARLCAAIAELVSSGGHVGYAGPLVMPTDEVVMYLFEGPEELVRLAAERAAIPYDRIIPTATYDGCLPAE
jgi:hypothetical protein